MTALKPKLALLVAGFLSLLLPINSRAEEMEEFYTVAPQTSLYQELRIKSNLLPWVLTVPNLGIEYVIGDRWSVGVDAWFCPWKASEKYSVKTVAVFPEGRWWVKTTKKGSFLNIHLSAAWFNVRFKDYRYQDFSRPLLGAGIGYGYRVELSKHWGFEFEIGAGMVNFKYERYYNVPNGALKDTRMSTYWGIDRLSLSFSYSICDL